MKKVVVIILVLFISIEVHANSSFGEKTIETMYFHDSGQLRVQFKESPTHTETCTSNSIYVIENSNNHFKEMVSGLMAALYSNTKVAGWVNGCVPYGSHTYPKITRLDLLGE